MNLRIGSPGAELLVQQADHFQGHRIQPAGRLRVARGG